MTKKQENETSKELGMDNKKTSGKSGKLKISVSAIRKGEKKTEGKRSNTAAGLTTTLTTTASAAGQLPRIC